MNKDVALVLSSGGARGIAHIGVIEELVERGYNITSISGTSMGAMVGGMYATGMLNEFSNWLCSIHKREMIGLIDFGLRRNGLVKGDKILKEMKKIIPDRNIEDLKIPYKAVATNLTSGSEYVFESGSLYNAIRASIAIPTVFTPHQIGDQHYIDGGVINPLPINRVERSATDKLIVVNVNARFENATTKPENDYQEDDRKILKLMKSLKSHVPRNSKDKPGYYGLLNRTIGLMLKQISLMTLEQHQPDVLINTSRSAFGTYDFYKAKDIIALGREAAKVQLDIYESEMQD